MSSISQTSTSSSILHPGLCLCYLCTTAAAAAALSVSSSTASSAGTVATNNHEIRHLQGQQPPFVNLYTPTTNVDDPARIDLDIQKVYTQALLGTSVDIDLAKDVYTGTAGYASTVRLESMGTIPKEYVMFPNLNFAYSGVYGYGDQSMKAAFDRQTTNFPSVTMRGGTNFDFSKLDAEGRAGTFYIYICIYAFVFKSFFWYFRVVCCFWCCGNG